MSSKPRLALLIGAGALALSASPASAHDTRFETDLRVQFDNGDDSNVLMAGRVKSDHRQCEGDRTVVLFARFEPGGPREQVDADQSSDNGAWALRGDIEGGTDGKVKVLKQDLRDGSRHDHICEGDSEPLPS